jgi:hypothetical protein
MKCESKKEYTAIQFKGDLTPALEKFIRKNFERDEDDNYKPENFNLKFEIREAGGLGKILDIICSGVDRSGWEFEKDWAVITGSWIVFETNTIERGIHIKEDKWFHHEFRQVTSIMQATKKAMDKITKMKAVK